MNGKIRIGTCSWSDRSLMGSGWYRGDATTPATRLRQYARHFDTVEVDSTFYAVPDQSQVYHWAARTYAGFLFNVKAWGLFTLHSMRYETLPRWARDHIPRPESGQIDYRGLPKEMRPHLWREFTSAIEPLRQMDRMGYLLFQLPPKVEFSPPALRYLERVSDIVRPFRIAVEVRNRTWMTAENRESFLSLLRAGNMAYVAVDEPELDWTVGRDAPVTASWGMVVRFHGRNKEAWMKRQPLVAERFRYLYSDGEMLEWRTSVQEGTALAETVFLMFNNCYRDFAVRNALRMQCLMGVSCRAGEGVQGELFPIDERQDEG